MELFSSHSDKLKRNMKSLFVFTLLLISCQLYAQEEEEARYIIPWEGFQEGSTEYMYGDNVVLRQKPSADSKAVDTLEIAQEITILKKSSETMLFNGKESNWYKVRTNGQVGYVLGGLISLDKVELDGDAYLVILAEDESGSKVRCRVVPAMGEFYGHEFPITNEMFQLRVTKNKGVRGVKHIVEIDQTAEACGMEGGIIYLFDTGIRLKSVLSCSSVSDAGAFWLHERLLFPEDREYSYDDGIVFEQEEGIYINDELGWTRSTINTLIIKWDGEELTPNVRELDLNTEPEY